jgi:hypothetical protein
MLTWLFAPARKSGDEGRESKYKAGIPMRSSMRAVRLRVNRDCRENRLEERSVTAFRSRPVRRLSNRLWQDVAILRTGNGFNTLQLAPTNQGIG